MSRRGGVVALCAGFLSACACGDGDSVGSLWSPPAAAVTPAPPLESGAVPGLPRPDAPSPYSGLNDPEPSDAQREAAIQQMIAPSRETQIRRLETRRDHLRRLWSGSDHGPSPRVEGVGRVRDRLLSRRIRELERDIRAGR